MSGSTGALPGRHLTFINAGPMTKAEELQTQMVVRSFAGSYGQRRNNKQQANPSAGSDRPVNQPWVPYHTIRGTSSSEQRKPGRKSKLEVRASKPSQPNSEIRKRKQCFMDFMNSVKNIEHFGAASFDPFNSLPRTDLPEAVLSSALSYTLSELLPQTYAGAQDGFAKSVVRGLWNSLTNNQSTFLCMVFGALCHHHARERQAGVLNSELSQKQSVYALSCQSEALRLLREDIEKLRPAITDHLLLGMMFLGCTEWDAPSTYRISGFQPSFHDLQCIDLYSQFESEPAHVDASFGLINSRGGLESILIPGVAPGLSYGDAMHATRNDLRPQMPFFALSPYILPQTLQSRLKFSFSDVEREFGMYRNLGLTDQMLELFQAIRNHERKILEYCSAGAKIDIVPFVDQRNLIQHSLLSISPIVLSGESNWRDAIYESCRLALIFYSLGVTFPLQLSAASWSRLLRKFYTALIHIPPKLDLEENYHPLAFRLLRWMSTIGSIAADRTSYRTNFVQFLSSLWEETAQPHSFETFKSMNLHNLLWFESACNAAGEHVWTEMLLYLRTD